LDTCQIVTLRTIVGVLQYLDVSIPRLLCQLPHRLKLLAVWTLLLVLVHVLMTLFAILVLLSGVLLIQLELGQHFDHQLVFHFTHLALGARELFQIDFSVYMLALQTSELSQIGQSIYPSHLSLLLLLFLKCCLSLSFKLFQVKCFHTQMLLLLLFICHFVLDSALVAQPGHVLSLGDKAAHVFGADPLAGADHRLDLSFRHWTLPDGTFVCALGTGRNEEEFLGAVDTGVLAVEAGLLPWSLTFIFVLIFNFNKATPM